ncbi:hypothetical protein [Pararhodobacter zhoushanensis]|uniref:hypothetical protein n=1 Tax=Pararhodobacter zhoushanensis TaxID=2479545 RepID=UPI000F8D83C6|nr:hypothetical protein [Pararhodobacter zhoushanensis]
MTSPIHHPNHVRAAIDRLGLPVDDVPRADPQAQGTPAMEIPHRATRVSTDTVQRLGIVLDRIVQLSQLIEDLNRARNSGVALATLGAALRQSFEDQGPVSVNALPHNAELGRGVIDGIVAVASVMRDELREQAAPYVKEFCG